MPLQDANPTPSFGGFGLIQLRGRVPAEGRVIEGVVNAAYEAVVTLPLRGPEGQYREIAAVIDTGYNGFLTLPTPVVAELGLAFGGISRATLANGSVAAFDVYDVTVICSCPTLP